MAPALKERAKARAGRKAMPKGKATLAKAISRAMARVKAAST
jgi:hypothetical protein